MFGANTTAQRCRIDHVQKHQQTLAHKQHVAALTQCQHCQGIACVMGTRLAVPSAKQFYEVILARKRGGSLGNMRTIFGRRQKLGKLQFCVAEAMRAMDREHIRKSDSLVFHCDGRNHRFTIKFSSGIESSLKVRRGFFGPHRPHTDQDPGA